MTIEHPPQRHEETLPPAGRPTLDDVPERVSLDVTYPHSSAVVVKVAGEVDAATVERFDEALWPRLGAAVRVVTVDLSELEFLGVTGTQLLKQAHLRAQARGIALRIVATQHEVLRALRAGELEGLCRSDLAAALDEDHSDNCREPGT